MGNFGLICNTINMSMQIVDFLKFFAKISCKNKIYDPLAIVFINYVLLRLKNFKNLRIKITALPDESFKAIIEKFFKDNDEYFDSSSCILGNSALTDKFLGTKWANICSFKSNSKYKVRILGFNSDKKEDCNIIYLSETMLFNLERTFNCENDTEYFVLPASKEPLNFAETVKISLISNSHECPTDIIDISLKNYFSNPRYLRKNDIIVIDIKKYSSGLFYSLPSPQLRYLYFKVNSIEIDKKRTAKPAFVFNKSSTLIQEGQIHSYLPKSRKLDINYAVDHLILEEVLSRGCVDSCSTFFMKYLNELEACILPFIYSDNWMGLKPILLIEGAQGSGKHHLITTLSRKLGLNFLNVDCSEIQTLLPSQTEAKLRIAFSNAETCVPCVLKLSNIHKFGINAEGNIDDRIMANFSQQITDLYSKKSAFPVIIIATTESSEIPAEINRNFIDKIKIAHLTEDERSDFVKWFLNTQNVQNHCDLAKISGMCSDLVVNDLKALTQSSIKRRYIREENKQMIKGKRKGAIDRTIEENLHENQNIEEKTKTNPKIEEESNLKTIQTLEKACQKLRDIVKSSKTTKNPLNSLKLKEKDFLLSYKSLQLIFSDEIGAPRIPEVHWEDIGGLAALKHEIIRRIEIPLLQNSGIQSSGILLYGPPGTGKTLLAKAVATECKLNFLSVKGPELLNMYVGQSEKNVREVFERAKGASPCVIFFDELDALAPNRGRSGDSGGVMDRVVSQLLAEMDGLGSSTSTFIIAATNRPDLIDPALLRPGRFDKLLYVGIYSDTDSQLSVLKAITRKFDLETEEILEKIVEKLPENLTGADLQAVCSNAWLNAAKRVIRAFEEGQGEKPEGDVTVILADFEHAVYDLTPSISHEELKRYEQLHRKLTNK